MPDDEVCYCGELMKDHTAWGSCTSPRAMPPPEPTWQDQPTCAGLWVVDAVRNGRYLMRVYQSDIDDPSCLHDMTGDLKRAYGPIPEPPS